MTIDEAKKLKAGQQVRVSAPFYGSPRTGIVTENGLDSLALAFPQPDPHSRPSTERWAYACPHGWEYLSLVEPQAAPSPVLTKLPEILGQSSYPEFTRGDVWPGCRVTLVGSISHTARDFGTVTHVIGNYITVNWDGQDGAPRKGWQAAITKSVRMVDNITPHEVIDAYNTYFGATNLSAAPGPLVDSVRHAFEHGWKAGAAGRVSPADVNALRNELAVTKDMWAKTQKAHRDAVERADRLQATINNYVSTRVDHENAMKQRSQSWRDLRQAATLYVTVEGSFRNGLVGH